MDWAIIGSVTACLPDDILLHVDTDSLERYLVTLHPAYIKGKSKNAPWTIGSANARAPQPILATTSSSSAPTPDQRIDELTKMARALIRKQKVRHLTLPDPAPCSLFCYPALTASPRSWQQSTANPSS